MIDPPSWMPKAPLEWSHSSYEVEMIVLIGIITNKKPKILISFVMTIGMILTHICSSSIPRWCFMDTSYLMRQTLIFYIFWTMRVICFDLYISIHNKYWYLPIFRSLVTSWQGWSYCIRIYIYFSCRISFWLINVWYFESSLLAEMKWYIDW